MAEKMLRGKAPLTIWRGAGGSAGGHLYRGGVVDPRSVDPDDRARLIAEGYLELVERSGEGWKLAQDTADGEKGDPVSVGDAGLRDPNEPDPGVVNTPTTPLENPEAETRRAEARAKLPADGSAPHANAGEPVWVEYAVKEGVDRAEAEKAGKDELRKLFANK